MTGKHTRGMTSGADGASADEVAIALRRGGIGEVDSSTRRRAEYSSDASNYRLIPTAVVFPRHRDEVAAALEVCGHSTNGVALAFNPLGYPVESH